MAASKPDAINLGQALDSLIGITHRTITSLHSLSMLAFAIVSLRAFAISRRQK